MKAFPTNATKGQVIKDEGMDLHHYFSAKAMQAYIQVIYQDEDHGWTQEDIAHDAYEMATTMMKEYEARK